MKRVLVGMACLVLSSVAFSAGTEEASEVRVFDYSGFTVVDTGYGIDVKIIQSPTYRVTLFASPVMMSKIAVEVSDRTLRIGRSRSFYLPPWTFRWKARVEISMPTIERLSASGGSHVDVAMDAATGSLLAILSGGSSLAGRVTCGSLEIGASGGSTAQLAGSATLLKLSGSGGSKFRMADLPVNDLDADLSGGSWVEGTVSETVTVVAGGGSHVTYHGAAKVVKQDMGGGSWIRNE